MRFAAEFAVSLAQLARAVDLFGLVRPRLLEPQDGDHLLTDEIVRVFVVLLFAGRVGQDFERVNALGQDEAVSIIFVIEAGVGPAFTADNHIAEGFGLFVFRVAFVARPFGSAGHHFVCARVPRLALKVLHFLAVRDLKAADYVNDRPGTVEGDGRPALVLERLQFIIGPLMASDEVVTLVRLFDPRGTRVARLFRALVNGRDKVVRCGVAVIVLRAGNAVRSH